MLHNVRGWRLRRTGGERENRFVVMQMFTKHKRLVLCISWGADLETNHDDNKLQ
jgi:hypothetical protein